MRECALTDVIKAIQFLLSEEEGAATERERAVALSEKTV